MGTTECTIREYRGGDEREIVDLWNRCLPRDEIDLTTFRRKVILDTNFDPHGCFVAARDGRIEGFMLSVRRRYPYYDLGLEPGKGWITVFFVHPDARRQHLASRLLQRTEAFLLTQDIHEVSVSDYTPDYFIPGIDMDAYADAAEFLRSQGYRKVASVYGMGRSLVDSTVPDEMRERFDRLRDAGFSVTLFRPHYTVQLLDFLRRNYPGDLFRVAHDRLQHDPECDEIMLALKGDDVVGFSHFQDERFGPLGIAREYSGRGLGPMLYYFTLEQMRKKGKRNLWLAWTTGRAKDFYFKVGLRVLRRHAIFRKTFK